MENSNYIHSDLTNQIIACFYKVYNKLGHGFLEKVYDSAMKIELHRAGLNFVSQPPVFVYYDEFLVGKYVPDLIVESLVVVENKAVATLVHAHEDQLKNALRATDLEAGLIFNFGVIPQLKRKVALNESKKRLKKQ
jgi:GxxExxY protein